MSWLNATGVDQSGSPLVAEISRLQRELDRANESIDDKLDKLEAEIKRLGGQDGTDPAASSSKRRLEDSAYIEQSKEINDNVKDAVRAGALRGSPSFLARGKLFAHV